MRELSEPLAYFQQYAEERLQVHIDVLESRYKGRKFNPLWKSIACKRHQKMFGTELSRKIDQLAPTEFDYIRLSLRSMKRVYAERLLSIYG